MQKGKQKEKERRGKAGDIILMNGKVYFSREVVDDTIPSERKLLEWMIRESFKRRVAGIDEEIAISIEKVERVTGRSRDAAVKAVRNLKKKGYIIRVRNGIYEINKERVFICEYVKGWQEVQPTLLG